MDFKEKLKNAFKKYNINISDENVEKFEKYYNMLILENEKYNLTAITEEDDVIVKHFLDSVLPADKIPENAGVLDIGSGAGFPALPLAILRKDLNITALDGVCKKVSFIGVVARTIQLGNVAFVHTRAEDYAKNFRETFDCVVSRAVAGLPTLLEYCLPFVKENGIVICYKGASANEEIETSKRALYELGGKIEDIMKFNLYGMERNIIIVRKFKQTPLKYPRNQNKPRLSPLI